MSSDLQILGTIPDDPRVHEALAKVKNNGEVLAAEGLEDSRPKGLEKYGITLRTQSVMHSTLLTRIMEFTDIQPEDQAWILLFTLAAPLEEVYAAMALGKKKGAPSFMARVQTWFETCGIPPEVSQEVLNNVAETFLLASKLSPKAPAESDDIATVKKKEPPGLSPSST